MCVEVSMLVSEPGKEERQWKQAKLTALAGNIQRNILSTTLLCESGWTFHQEPHSFSLVHRSGVSLVDTCYFAGCPWFRLRPTQNSDSMHSWETCQTFELAAIGERQTFLHPQLCPVTRAEKEELENHRMQGHIPHHPQCVQCARGHSTFQRRRRTGKGLQTELQADFCFLKKEGETLLFSEKEGNVKVLVIVELGTNAIGYVVMNESKNEVYALINQWLQQFGFSSANTSILLHTDAEKAVGDLFTKACSQFSFSIRRSHPQQHQSNGGAERCVRRLKENLAILRADLNKCGVDVKFSPEALQLAASYIALCHNHFCKTPGTDMSPLEIACGRRLSKPVTSLFATTVLAELPDSIRGRAPDETRMVEAAFLHAGTSHGPLVQGRVRIDGESTMMRLTARNVRVIRPVQWNLELCGDVVYRVSVEATPALQASPNSDVELVDARTSTGVDSAGASNAFPFALRGHVAGGNANREQQEDVEMPAVEPKESEAKVVRKVSFHPEVEETVEPKGPVELKKSFEKTKRCPACETGMNAPGIRHNAECKRKKRQFDDMQEQAK